MSRHVQMSRAGWLVAYVATSVLGRQLLLPETGLALFWPAAGVAALWMMWAATAGWRSLDACLLVAVTFAVNVQLGVAPVPAALFGVANLLQGAVVAWWWGDRGTLGDRSTTRDLGALSTACLLASVASAPLGTSAAWVGSGEWSWFVPLHWVVRNSCGSVVLIAVFHTATAAWHGRRAAGSREELPDPGTATSRPARGEQVIAAALSATLTVAVFVPQEQLPVAFVPLAAAAWFGVRYTTWAAMAHVAVAAVAATWLTYLGRGPFGDIAPVGDRVLVAQLYVVLAVVLTLLLAIGDAERTRLLSRARRSEAAAAERADLLDAVLHVMRDGLVVIGSDGRPRVTNRAAARLLETAEAATTTDSPPVVGIPLVQHDGRPLDLARLAQHLHLHGEQVEGHDFEQVDPRTGQERVVSLSAVPLSAGTATPEELAVIALRDVTADRVRVRELEDYAAVVAHDLKSPLAAVVTWTELISRDADELPGPVAERTRSGLGHVRVAADQAITLVDELLLYAHAQTGTLTPEVTDLTHLARQVADEVTGAAGGPRPVIEVLPLPSVVVDQVLVKQVFRNVLGNAVKYVAPGTPPRVCVSATDGDGWATVSVQDNGVGIEPADRRRVLDSFYRSAATAGQFTGTGLGLAITARAVERHGGSIRIDASPDGPGTVVSFGLPLAAADASGAALVGW